MDPMRIATWNCQTGLTNNWEVLEALDTDIATIQECGDGTPDEAAARSNWSCAYKAGRWGRGLAVLARAPYLIEAPEESGEPFIVSRMISGPRSFRFVGFWAMTERDVGYSYPRQAARLIEHLPSDGVDVVIAGDFNASKSAQHLANVAALRELGLASGYHSFHGIAHEDKEEYPTSFHQWNPSRPFHMDFIVVPSQWTISSVEVGSFDDYVGARVSDHTPVVVTVAEG